MGAKADLKTIEEWNALPLPSGETGSEAEPLPGEQADDLTAPLEEAPETATGDVEQAASTAVRDASRVLGGIAAWTDRAHDFVANQPTPGGVSLMILLMLLLTWAMLPANGQGYTRIQLLWYTLLGRVTLPGHQTLVQPGSMPAGSNGQQPTPPIDLGPFGTYDFTTPWGYP